MDLFSSPTVARHLLSSTVRGQERISYIREDDTNSYPTDSYFLRQVRSPTYGSPPSRPQRLSLQMDTPDDVFTEAGHRNGFNEGNVAYVKPITRRVLSPIEGPMKFQSGQDEFLIFGTSRRLRSEFNDELRLREQKVAEREAQLQRQLEENEERRQIERMELMEQMKGSEFIIDDGDEYDEEIIEDTITTRRKPRVQAEIAPFNYPTVEAKNKMHSIGVGESDVNQIFLLDTGSHSVNPADFPPPYWERLGRYFTEEIKHNRPSCRDVALQLTPKQRAVSQAAYVTKSRLLRNFGVCVKPTTSSGGFSTDPVHSPGKQSTASITDDLDEYFARLLRSICTEYPNADQTFIKKLYRYSGTNVSFFIRRLAERLEELRRLEIRNTLSPPSTKPQMVSVGLNGRSVMFDKQTVAEPSRQNLETNTGLIICRSQGTSHTPPLTEKSPAMIDVGCSIDCLPKSEVTSPETQEPSPPIAASPIRTEEPISRKVTTYRIKRVSGFVNNEGKMVSSRSFETEGEGEPPPSALLDSLNDLLKNSKNTQESIRTQPSTTSDPNKHSMSENVMMETWIDKEIPKQDVSPNHRGTSPKTTNYPPTSSECPLPAFLQTVEVARSPTFVIPEDSDSSSAPQHQPQHQTQHRQFRRTVARTLSPSLGTTALYPASSPNIPLRNYTYKVTSELRRAVETLGNFYLTSPGGTLTDDLQENMATIRKAWFETVSRVDIELEQMEDLFALLYNSAPQLLYAFVRMPTSRGSTCLHYAVGHGAWRVVALILNTGYAEADQKNAFGFSPIMIAAISDSIDSLSMPILERLLSTGNVNERAGSAPGQTPLMLAARKANIAVVEMLLRHGADVNTQDDIGNTALMCAADCGNVEMVKLLIAQPDLNIDLKDQEGSTALSIAEASGNEEIAKLLRDRSITYKSSTSFRAADISSFSRDF